MSASFRAIVIDDERLARQDLIAMLRQHATIQVIGEAQDVPTAAEAIRRLDPDVVFLDIQMPGRTGFELLPDVPAQVQIIFVTAHDEYALRAFEVNALDYLMKPVMPERLAKAIARLTAKEARAGRALEYADSIYLRIDRTMTFLKVKTIVAIRAADDYSEVLTEKGKRGLTDKTMREWESRLPAERFCRIHRSGIINLAFVEGVEEIARGSFHVHLKGVAEPLVMSRRYAARLKHQLG